MAKRVAETLKATQLDIDEAPSRPAKAAKVDNAAAEVAFKCPQQTQEETLLGVAKGKLFSLTGLQCGDRLFVRWIVIRSKTAAEPQETDPACHFTDIQPQDINPTTIKETVNQSEQLNSSTVTSKEVTAISMPNGHTCKHHGSGETDDVNKVVTCGIDSESNEDGGDCGLEEEIVWWPGVIQRCSDGHCEDFDDDAQEKENDSSSDRRDNWEIHYASHGEFEAEVRRVKFVKKRKLLDVASGGVISFCLPDEKDEFEKAEADAADGESGNMSPCLSDEIITVGELVQAQDELDRQQGDTEFSTADELLVKTFNDLPILKQMRLASGFRHFSDDLHDFLQRKIEVEGASFVLTKEAVNEFCSNLRQPDELVAAKTDECPF